MVQISPTLRFLFAGGWGFVACGVAGAVIAADLGTHQFTLSLDGWQFVGIYSCFTMMMFGAVYFIMPRLTGCEWNSAKSIRFHFWFNVYGGLAIAGCYFLAGFAQSISLNSWDGLSTALAENPKGWHVGRAIGWFFVILANVSFFFHLLLMSLRFSRRSEYATLLGHGHDEADHSIEVATPEAVKA
jgi:cytochrome c oxidase cbb3-type subunit 1